MEDTKSMELLMKVSNDVAEIKSDMKHVQEEMKDFRSQMNDKNDDFDSRITTVEKKVSALENKDNANDAKKWRKAVGYICTALGAALVTFILINLGNFIKFLGKG